MCLVLERLWVRNNNWVRVLRHVHRSSSLVAQLLDSCTHVADARAHTTSCMQLKNLYIADARKRVPTNEGASSSHHRPSFFVALYLKNHF